MCFEFVWWDQEAMFENQEAMCDDQEAMCVDQGAVWWVQRHCLVTAIFMFGCDNKATKDCLLLRILLI